MCELHLALSQRCSPFSSPFLGLFEKAHFFRPKQGFWVNIALFEFFTVVVDLPCMSTVYGYRTIAYIGRPLHAHVPDYHSSRQYSIINMSTMMMSWVQWQFLLWKKHLLPISGPKRAFYQHFSMDAITFIDCSMAIPIAKRALLLVSGPKRALYELFRGTRKALRAN